MKKLKISLIALAINLLVLGGTAYASFPAKKDQAPEQRTNVSNQLLPAATNAVTTIQAQEKASGAVVSADTARGGNDKWITLALWFFLGGLAAHRWYKRKPIGWNILYIITFGGCGVWALIDLINILTDNF